MRDFENRFFFFFSEEEKQAAKLVWSSECDSRRLLLSFSHSFSLSLFLSLFLSLNGNQDLAAAAARPASFSFSILDRRVMVLSGGFAFTKASTFHSVSGYTLHGRDCTKMLCANFK
jgi:hypothetical protein